MRIMDIKNVNELAQTLTGIYEIVINNKSYIGSSVSIKHRLKHHLWSLKNNKHHNRTMQNLFNKYGNDAVYYDIVEYCKKDDLIDRESYHIQMRKPYINHILNPVTCTKDSIYKQRLSDAGKKRFANGEIIHNKKATYMYDLDGKFIRNFSDATAAAKWCNSNSPTMICNVCRKIQYTAYGYRWSYEKFDMLDTYKKNYKETAVVQLTIAGDIIKKWSSITEAKNELKISNITRAIKYNRTAGGYKWKETMVRNKSCEFRESPEMGNPEPSLVGIQGRCND